MTRRISIFGLGYVGLCTAIGFTNKDHYVIAVDKDIKKIDSINHAILQLHEPGLNELLQNTIDNRRLSCISNCNIAILNSDITYMTVGTPSDLDGSINLSQIENAASEIGEALGKKDGYHLVVVKSTVVPGTTEDVVKVLLEEHSGKSCGPDFGLCMNPEFLREGSAVNDTLHPDRIVIGEYDKKSGDLLQTVYAELYPGESIPTIRTNMSTAEMIKYANNSFLATKISYINTIANICEKIPKVDIKTVAFGIGLDHRINPKFLDAGIGYGGSCFPKDVKAIIAFSKKLGYAPILLEATHEVNEKQAKKVIEKTKEMLANLKGKKIAILGLAFKPETDDMREARSITIINQLLMEGAKIAAYDPVAIPVAKTIFGNKINYASSALTCLKDADCCVIVTEWNEFKKLTPKDFAQQMKHPYLIDGRRIFNPKEYCQLYFEAVGLGK